MLIIYTSGCINYLSISLEIKYEKIKKKQTHQYCFICVVNKDLKDAQYTKILICIWLLSLKSLPSRRTFLEFSETTASALIS